MFQQQAAQIQDAELPLPPGADSISSLDWNPAGNMIAAASWDNKMRIWEVQRNGPNGPPTGGTGKAEKDVGAPVLDVEWKDDGATLFGVGCGKTVKMWSLQTDQVMDIGTHDAPAKGVHWVKEKQFLVTGGWDKTIKYWDARTPTAQFSLNLPERVCAMDVRYPLLICSTMDKKIYVFHLDNPQKPYREFVSPLKYPTRTVRAFRSRAAFALGSIEGRVAIRAVEETQDSADVKQSDGKSITFAFKCHREGAMIYSINSIDTHPSAEYQGVFSTAGSDGIVNFWDKDARSRTREMKQAPAGQPVSCGLWNPVGDLFAYAKSYDWSRGAEAFDLNKEPTKLFVHWTQAEQDLKNKTAAK